MNILPLALQLAALVCLLFAAFNLMPTARVAWGWLGLFLWVCSFMLGGIVLHSPTAVH